MAIDDILQLICRTPCIEISIYPRWLHPKFGHMLANITKSCATQVDETIFCATDLFEIRG